MASPSAASSSTESEREAGEETHAEFDRAQAPVDLVERSLRGRAHALVGFRVAAVLLAREQRREQLAHLRVVARGERLGRLQALLHVGAAQPHRGGRQSEDILDRAVGFLGERRLQHRQQVVVVAALQRLGRRPPRRAVRRGKAQRRERAVEFAAQPVVDDDRLDVGGRGPERVAVRRVRHLAGGDDEGATADDRERLVRQRFQHRDGAGFAARADLAHGGDPRVRLVAAELREQGRIERGARGCRHGKPEQARDDESRRRAHAPHRVVAWEGPGAHRRFLVG
jgi:hypothetical protein